MISWLTQLRYMWWCPGWHNYGICDEILTDTITVYVMISWLTPLRYMWWYPGWHSYGICDDILADTVTVFVMISWLTQLRCLWWYPGWHSYGIHYCFSMSHWWGGTILKEFQRTLKAICPVNFRTIYEVDQERKDISLLFPLRISFIHTNDAVRKCGWCMSDVCGAVR